MKLFKKLAILCATISLCVGFSAFAACGGSKNNSAPTYTINDVVPAPSSDAGYYFKIVNADGTPAKDVKIQLCKGTEMCFEPIALDASGNALYNPNGFPGAGVYDIHVLGGEWGDEQLSFDGVQTTPDAFPANYIILALK